MYRKYNLARDWAGWLASPASFFARQPAIFRAAAQSKDLWAGWLGYWQRCGGGNRPELVTDQKIYASSMDCASGAVAALSGRNSAKAL
jgi:hypothetical protein